MKKNNYLLSLAAFVLLLGNAQADTILFEFQSLAADGSNVANDGIVHAGANYGAFDNFSPAALEQVPLASIINGVDFNGGAAANRNDVIGNSIADRSGSNTFYDALGVNTVTDGIGFAASMTFGVNNLIIGHDYRVQVISFDPAVGGGNFDPDIVNRTQMVDSAGNDGSIEFSQTYDGASSVDNARAALIIGTWTAESTEIEFTVSLTGNNDNAILNGFVVQDLTAIPEPASAGLLGIALIGFVCQRRRKQE